MTSPDLAGLTPAEKRDLLRRLVDRQHEFPLSAGQQRLWLLQQLAPESNAYNFPIALRIRSRYDPAHLHTALTQLCERHEIFRVTFVERDGAVFQRAHRSSSLQFDVVDAAHVDGAELAAMVDQEASRPFDLTRGPVFRATLYRRSDSDAVLLLAWHHIVLDGWSLALVLEELDIICAALAAGHDPALPPAPGYRAFVDWQHQLLAGEAGTRQRTFWNHSVGAVERLNLPLDFPRPAQRGYRGSSHFFAFDAALTQALRARASELDTTPFVVLLSALQALLFRITGNTRVPVSYPVNGRTASQFARTAGYFVNQLSAVASVEPTTTFRELVAQTRATVLAALEHQDFHLSLLEPDADGADHRLAVADVMFVLQKSQSYMLDDNHDGSASDARGNDTDADIEQQTLGNITVAAPAVSGGRLGNMSVESFPLRPDSARYDLELQMMERRGVLTGWLQVDAELFTEHTADAMISAFQQLVRSMVQDLDVPVSRADLLAAEHRATLQHEWQEDTRTWDEDVDIATMFTRVAVAHASEVAVTCDASSITFAELDTRSAQVAHWLRAAGVSSGAIVGLAVPRSIDAVVAMIGIVRMGGVYLPIDPAGPPARTTYALADARVQHVITGADSCGCLAGLVDATVTRVLCMHCDAAIIGDLPTQAAPTPAGQLLYVIYTSGSSGEPKGVLGTQAGTINRIRWMWEQLPFQPNERGAQTTTFNFVDHVWEIFGPLLAGVPIDIVPDEVVRDLDELLATLERHGATRITVVPSLLCVMLQHPALPARTTQLQYWTCSGERLVPELATLFHRVLPHARLFNLYGCSEASGDSCWFEVPRDVRDGRVPIGRPIANTRIYLLDAHGNLVPPGVPGELHIAGAGLSAGYLHRDELTSARFIDDPFVAGGRMYRTGDLARQRSDRNYEYLGRADAQLKIRGNRVEPAEVEAALVSFGAVKQAVVAAYTEASGDEALAAYIVPTDGIDDDARAALPASVRQHLGQRVPTYMVPSRIIVMSSFPVTATGKLDRRALPAPGTITDVTTRVEPRTQLERELVAIWCEVLSVTALGIDDDFFEHGGHSILALQAAARTSKYLGRHVAVARLFQHPTVRLLALALQQELEPDAAPAHMAIPHARERHRLVVVQPGGSQPPLYWIPGGAGTLNFEGMSRLAASLGEDQPVFGLGTRWAERIAEVESVEERAREYRRVLQDAQAGGPYFMAGFCLGGVVAYEVAQQLRADGAEVRFLAMVNSWMPARSIARSRWVGLYVQRAAYHARAALREEAPHRYLLRRVHTARRVFGGKIAAEGEQLLAQGTEPDAPMVTDGEVLVRAAAHLASQYTPRRFDGPLQLYLSNEPGLEGVSEALDPRLGWRRVCSTVRVTRISGGHEPEPVELGMVLREHLAAARRQDAR